jgi:alpha-L-rhamnosidase
MKTKIYQTLLFSLFILFANAQYGPPTGEPDVINKRWHAQWITVPGATNDGYGVYLFRKSIDLPIKPSKFVIHVSADNRYKLFINQKLVSMGPARGDIAHWNYETLDISTYLKSGKNVISAQVWNEGEFKPEAQISYRTAFILQGNTSTEGMINTNTTWLCEQDKSYSPTRFTVRAYYVAGAGEVRNMATSPKDWQSENFEDKNWQKARPIGYGVPKNVLGAFGTMSGWMLVPSIIPQMELKDERLAKVANVEGNIKLPEGFPLRKNDVVIAPNTSVKIILDQSFLTNAYPNVEFSGGKDASITLNYAESMYTKYPLKGNRNVIEGKQLLGRKDSLISDGSNNQKFVSLTYRTYRYIQVNIKTKNEPIILNDIYGTFTGYPFKLTSSLTTSNVEMNKILDIGWRTARLCAYETYMDCPYYEQLQYIGDGRIQAMVSLYNSGDDRLVKNAINLIDFSRQPEGVTLSRHPSYTPQFIPTFSLWYIGMLQDYSRYAADIDFIKGKMGGVRQILGYFKSYQLADGSLKNTPQWMFTDWVENKEWKSGSGPIGANGTSAVLDLQLLWAYQVAADLENKVGTPAFATQYLTSIELLKKTIRAKYWDSNKKLFADREEKDEFSQHTNSLAILTGMVSSQEASQIANQLITNSQLAPASIYFKYYLHQALIKAGLGNDYLTWLDKWRENISMGLTTWAETSNVENTRSDCHAWGSSPNIEFYRTILGIDSDGLAFSKVKIMPHLGQMTDIKGAIPHPKGSVSASYKMENGKWNIQIELPKTITGNLIWKGKTIPLKEGQNLFII